MSESHNWGSLPEATLGPESVSVIIPTYNRAALVIEAVMGALRQSHTPVEVIVVDDGSTDATESALAPYRDRIRYIPQANRGLAAARNRGILEARGAYLAFLDSDDVCLPTWVEKAVLALRRYPEAGAVASAEYEMDAAGSRGRIHTKRTAGIWFTPEGLISRDTGVGSGRPPIVRREWVRRLGGFDTSIRCAVDCAMWIPYSFQMRMVLQPEPVILRRIHSGNLSGNIRMDAWDWIGLLAKLRREQPGFCRQHSRLVRRVVAKNLVRYGRETLASGSERGSEVAEARRALLSAIRECPAFIRAWSYLLMSYLAPSWYGGLRRLEQTVRMARFDNRIKRQQP
jgi:glycosyltransferase involved in cell wall biosynthesis